MCKISIIIPVYNTQKYIYECLESVLRQTFTDFEVICVNDGSTDNSLKILKKYEKKDKRIKIINQENKGAGGARNTGIKNAKGEYISFVDSDDWLEENYYECLYDLAKKNNADITCATLMIKKHNGDKAIDKFENVVLSSLIEKTKYICNGSCSSKLFKKELIKNISFPEKVFYEDNYFLTAALIKSKKVVFTKEINYNYRENLNSSTRNIKNKSKLINDGLIILEKIKKLTNKLNTKEANSILEVFTPILLYTEEYKKNKAYKEKIDNILDEKIIKKFTNNTTVLEKIFSVKNNREKTHKIIMLLGIKIKIKKKPALTIIQNSYKKIKERLKFQLKNNEKLRVLFLIRENSKWTYDSLFKEMMNSKEFEPVVAVSLLTGVVNGLDKTRNNLEENYNFFKNLGYNVVKAYDENKKEYIDLKEFNPDIVFYDQQYELPDIHSVEKVSNYSLTASCAYGFEFFKNSGSYTQNFHMLLYVFFVDNECNIKRYKKFFKLPIKNCRSFGYPKLDIYFENSEIDLKKYWKEPRKYKIIYAPHHSFEKNGLRLATFKENGKFILELARKHPETTWIFKPHPRFKHALLVNNIMTEVEIENYYKEWEKIGKVYTQGNYFDIFKTSDLLITDCCSFLGEYLPANKPIIYLVNAKHAPFNELGRSITKSNYKAYSPRDVKKLYEEIVVKNNDYKKEERKETIAKIINFSECSANKICNYFLKEIKNKY